MKIDHQLPPLSNFEGLRFRSPTRNDITLPYEGQEGEKEEEDHKGNTHIIWKTLTEQGVLNL